VTNSAWWKTSLGMRFVPTICPYCGTGCGLYLKVEGNRVLGVAPSLRNPVSKGRLCVKGWNAHSPIGHPDRLTTPLVRRNGALRQATWEDAIGLIADALRSAASTHGPNAVGVFSSARCTNEENYLAQKLARAGLGTNNVDHCARTCHSPTVAGLSISFGSGAMTNSIDDLADSPCIFAIGCNAPEAHPLVAWRVRTAKDRGATLIVADPRRTELARWSDLHLQLYPGTDIALLNGLMHAVVTESLHRREFIEQRTEGFDEMWQVVRQYPPGKAAAITGVPEAQIVAAARLMGRADRVATIYTLGITEHTVGTHNVMSVANLAMTLGSVGKPGAGVNPLRGQNNVQGACDMGALPNVLPGYQQVTDGTVRAKFEQAWGVSLASEPGLTLTDMLIQARAGNLKALYIIGEDPMMSDPNQEHVRQALESLDFLACQEIFLNETCRLADVVLPAGSFAEKDGTFTNTERRVQLLHRAVASPGEARPDWQIICALGEALGLPMPYSGPAQVMDEMASLSPIYGGISHSRLVPDGLQWPCPDASHPGTPILHTERFTRGLGKFMAIEHEPPAETPDPEYPLILSTGRMLFHYNVGTMTRRTPVLHREHPRNFVEISPADARRLGIRPNGKAKVTTRRGALTVEARVTEDIKEGVIWMPFHFAETPTNALTNDAFCPISRTGEYKACAASVEPA